jgi:drug/metabolite transporter (DMT)-like permease
MRIKPLRLLPFRLKRHLVWAREGSAAISPRGRGIVFMVVNALCAALMVGSIRHLSDGMHPFEVVFFRNFFGALALLPWFARYGVGLLKTQRFGLHLIRAGTSIVGMLLFFYAVSLAPLAQMTALGFLAPVFATLMAVFFLGENVRVRRMVAMACGFVGAFAIIRPGFETVNAGALMVVGSSASWALALIAIKVLSRTDSSVTITAHAAILMAALSLVPAVFVWQWPSPDQLFWLFFIGILGTLGQLCLAQSFRLADVSTVLPFDFTRMIWVAAIGYLAFSEIPDIWTWIGSLIIFSSTVYIAYREKHRKTEPGILKTHGP